MRLTQRFRQQAVLAVLASMAMLSACSGDAAPSSSGSSTPGPNTPDEAATEATGASSAAGFELTDSLPAATGPVERAVWAITREPSTLDPARTARNHPTETVRAALCESLWRIEADRTLSPALAESVENPDPLTWVYSIREGVTFHDGAPLTAADVAASLQRHTDPEVGSVVSGVFENVASIEATGDLEVTVTMAEPDYLFNQQMGGEAGRIESAVFLEQAGPDYGTPEVGVNCTGPYELGNWATGESVTLTAFEDYWDNDLAPQVQEYEIVWAGDAASRTNAMIAGEIDGSYGTPNEAADALRSTDAGNLYFGEATQTHSMIANTNGVMGDPQVRQAVSLALDRVGLTSAGYAGYATPARLPVSKFAFANLGPDAAEAAYESLPDTSQRNLEEARRLVEEAGVQGEEVVISYISVVPEMIAMANATMAAIEEIGMEPVLNEMAPPDFSTLTSDPAVKDETGTDLWPLAFRQATGDPMELLVSFRTGNGFNYGEYTNPDYDALVDEALAVSDDEERAEAAVELAQIIAEDVPWIPLVTPAYSLYLGTELTGAPTQIETLSPWAAYVGAAG